MTQTVFWFTREDAGIWLPGARFLVAAVVIAAAFTTFATLRGTSSGP